jgi:surface polysaccharide O-acyltransferase-like enzyme
MSQKINNTARTRTASLDYLRAFIVLNVVCVHAWMAYMVMWPGQPQTFQIMSAPIINPQRWIGFDVLMGFMETYVMARMCLLSGLFVWPALERKGAFGFLRERLWRLGVPFAVSVAILVPLTYYPAYAVTGAAPGFLAFAHAWLSLGFWTSGIVWFLWVLFVFDAITAGFHALRRCWPALRTVQIPRFYSRPAGFAAVLLALSALVYVPMEWVFGEDRWLGISPFWVQASRPLLYAVYFGIGVQLGTRGLDSTVFGRTAGLARQWPLWLAAGLAIYALRLAVIVILVQPAAAAHQPLPLASHLLYDLTRVLCCGIISLACIGLFCRFANQRRPVLDSFSANSYGIYLVHIAIVVWLQFALLAVAADPLAKGIIVVAGAVTLSWVIVAALRRIPAITRVL